MYKTVECCGCGRFRVAAPESDLELFGSCVECMEQGARGRIWDSYKRRYVSLDSQHDTHDSFDDGAPNDGGRFDAVGRL